MSSEPARSKPVTASIAPWLSVADATQAVDYYKMAFGAFEYIELECSYVQACSITRPLSTYVRAASARRPRASW